MVRERPYSSMVSHTSSILRQYVDTVFPYEDVTLANMCARFGRTKVKRKMSMREGKVYREMAVT
jgi:hypothetical protein